MMLEMYRVGGLTFELALAQRGSVASDDDKFGFARTEGFEG